MREATAPAGHVDQLVRCLHHPDRAVRDRALRFLVDIDDPRVTAALLENFPRFGPSVGVVPALTRHGDPALVEPLLHHLSDPDPIVRQAACRALGSLRDQRATPFLVTRLDDADPLIRRAACHAVGQLLDRNAIPLLVARLDDAHPRVREAAAWSLMALRDPQATAAVVRRWQDRPDEDINVLMQVRAALRAYGVPIDERWGWPAWYMRAPTQAESLPAMVTREDLLRFMSEVHNLLKQILDHRLHAVARIAHSLRIWLPTERPWKLGRSSGKRVRQQLKSLEAHVLHTERQWAAASIPLQPVLAEQGARVILYIKRMIAILEAPADARLREDELRTAVRELRQFVAVLPTDAGRGIRHP